MMNEKKLFFIVGHLRCSYKAAESLKMVGSLNNLQACSYPSLSSLVFMGILAYSTQNTSFTSTFPYSFHFCKDWPLSTICQKHSI